MKWIKFSIFAMMLLVMGLLVGACQSAVSPATPEIPNRILFIGDSFTYWNDGVDTHLEALTASADPPLIIETSSVTRGGLDLAKLWVTRPTLEEIQAGNWDAVVLQEDLSLQGYDEQEFYEYVRKFDEEIKKVDTQTVLYMPWELHKNREVPITTEEIALAYSNIGSELGVRVAPAGLAWKRSIQERPDINLYDADWGHPSMRGTYLTTCVLYATIFEESPAGLTYKPAAETYQGDQSPMTEEEMAFLQRIAWETVLDYQAEQQ